MPRRLDARDEPFLEKPNLGIGSGLTCASDHNQLSSSNREVFGVPKRSLLKRANRDT
jgi:hypothetical protein